MTTIQQAVGTAIQQNYAAYTYTTNGKQYSVTDANGNRAEMRYDGHDRQTHWYFPSKTSVGQINTADYEQYSYDAAGNRTQLRKRDGLWIGYQYDALNRVIRKTVPERSGLSSTHTRDVFYGYDVGDRQLYARFDSHSGEGASQTYDSLGRLKSSTLAMDGVTRTLNYTLDAGGRRTELTWPDALKTSFTYDNAGRMLSIREGATGSTNTLWAYSWSDYGRRVRKTAKYGQYAEAQADGLGRMTSLTTDLSSTTHDNTTSFLYNPASQIGSRTISNNAFAWTNHVDVDRPYAVNGLNQYTTAGPASFTYDANGNLTGDGSSTYLYDIENRLVSGSGATTAQLRYDPLGRLYETSGGTAGTTRFLYDGDELVAEYNGTGTLLRRFVHGAAVDDPMVWYEGSGYADPRWLTADHQGSVVGISRSSSTLGINSYDPYGIPATANLGRFQYTGQAWIPELKMYHYKARIYSPTLGRFLQTDPIGYEDQINLYAYVGNDPINALDPTGKCQIDAAGEPTGICPNSLEAAEFLQERFEDPNSGMLDAEQELVEAGVAVQVRLDSKDREGNEVNGGSTIEDASGRFSVTIDTEDVVEVDGVDAETGEVVTDYQLSPQEIVEHEIVGHVINEVRGMDTEQRALEAENRFRERQGNNFRRVTHDGRVRR